MLSLVPVTETPFNAESPFEALFAPRTSSDLFFVRSHFEVPDLAPSNWRLEVGGTAAVRMALSLDELRALGSVSLDVTIECAGNGRPTLMPLPAGTPWGLGAVATAGFTGAPLRALIEAASPSGKTVEVMFVGADEGMTKAGAVEPYARSLPLDLARHPDVLLAWSMNDEPLTAAHGRPLRLVVPGWYGMASVKWLREIRFLEVPFRGFFQTDDYVFRDRVGTPDGTPLSRMAPRALILSPRHGETIPGGAEIRGIAWSGGGAIARVEISADGGTTWRDAELGRAASAYAARTFRSAIAPRKGTTLLVARATDASVETQPDRAVWNRLGYVNNGWHRVEVSLQ